MERTGALGGVWAAAMLVMGPAWAGRLLGLNFRSLERKKRVPGGRL